MNRNLEVLGMKLNRYIDDVCNLIVDFLRTQVKVS